MKTLLALALSAGLTFQALAIPQTFNGNNGFVIAAGMAFQDFAGRKAAFEPGAEMPGKWTPVHGKKNVLKLDMDTPVFGIKASEITAQKTDKQVVQFSVVYRADDHRQEARVHGSLQDRVIAAINAFTGKSISAKTPVDYQGVLISVSLAGNGDVRVDFIRAS